jgi:hypothetical protein
MNVMLLGSLSQAGGGLQPQGVGGQ